VIDTDRSSRSSTRLAPTAREEAATKAGIEALKIQKTESLRQLSLWNASTGVPQPAGRKA
jgi:hypothetical protein